LAATQLDVGQYQAVVFLSEALADRSSKRPDFVRACEKVKIAVDAGNRVRREMGKNALAHEEKDRFIQKTIEETVGRKDGLRK